MASSGGHSGRTYWVGLCAIVIATSLRLVLNPVLGDAFPFATLFFAVLFTAWQGGLGPALLATLLGGIASHLLLIEHPAGWSSISAVDRNGLLLYVIVGAGIALLGGGMRRARQLSEEASRTAIQRQRDLATTLRSIGDAVIVTDATGVVQSLNPIAEQLTGWKASDAAGRSLEDVFRIFNENTGAPVESPVAKVLREGTIVGLANHTVLLARDGARHPIDDSAAPIFDDAGSLTGVILVFRDVSERRRGELSNQRLAAIIESSDDAVISKTLDGTITTWNAGAERIYGYTADEVIGRPFSVLIPAHLPDEVRSFAERLRRGERLDHFETIRQRKDGRQIDVSVSYSPLHDGEGDLIGIAVITRDITERKLLEQRQRVQLELTAALANSSDLSEASENALRSLCKEFQWDTGAIWLTDAASGVVSCVSVYSAESERLRPFLMATRHARYVFGESLPGRVWRSNAAIWIAQVSEDRQLLRRQALIDSGLQSALACPIHAGREVLGAIEFFSSQQRDSDPALIEFMRTVGGQIGLFFERITAESELRKSQQELTDFFDNATVGLHWVGPDGTILRVNDAELRLLGYRRDEYVGRHIAEFHVDQSVIEDILRRLANRETLQNYPARMRCRDGSVKDVLIDSSVLWEDERFVHTRCFTRDVTEMRRADAEIRQRQRQLQLVSDNAPVFIAHCDREHRFKFVNRAYAERFGLTPREVVGRTIADVLGQKAFEAITPFLAEVLKGRRVEYELEVPYEKLGPQFMLCAYAPEFGEDGKVVGHVAAVTNVTERKRAETNARFLADASATLAGIVDYASTLQAVSRLAVPKFADWCVVDMLQEGDKLERVAVAHVSSERLEVASEMHARFPPNKELDHGTWRVIRTGDPQLIPEITDEMLTSAIRDPAQLEMTRAFGLKSYMGVPIVARGRVLGAITFLTAESARRYDRLDLEVAEDLANRAAVAIENCRLYEELRVADRRKDEFLAILAHELRNPLAPLRNAVEILRISEGDRESEDFAREIAERQVQALSRMVDDLLDVSRIMQRKIELKKERVDLRKVVDRAVEIAKPTIDASSHRLEVDLPGAPLWSHVDVIRIAQVISNLLHNAAKYTDHGGVITIRASAVDDIAEIRVIDTGIGIAPDKLAHVFDLFMQVDSAGMRAQGGLGIGLTVVRSIVELHGGTVEARSAGVGQGSEFVVRLGLAGIESYDNESPKRAAAAPSARRTILVVDDNVDAARTLARLVEMHGHDALVAHDALAGLELAEKNVPNAAFVDLGMPTVDGFEFAKRARANGTLRETVLIALTGWGQESDRQRTQEVGFDVHEVKPLDPHRLKEILDSCGPPPGSS